MKKRKIRTKDRKKHHIVSGQIVREDAWLGDWFDEDEIEIIAKAVEDHRASSDHEPRSFFTNPHPQQCDCENCNP